MDDEDIEEKDEKKKNNNVDYGKISVAIGKMINNNVTVLPPDINKSKLIFAPDIKNNSIIYGLKGLTRIGDNLIKDIFNSRPYTSIEDFLSKVKVNKTQMISLIKSGAFDSLYNKPRKEIMNDYLNLIADKKKRITLQNMQMLIAKDMIPEKLDFEKKVFNFNKYLKKNKTDKYYFLDNIAMGFYKANYDEELLESIKIDNNEITGLILQTKWDSIYKKAMDPVRKWMKENQEEILNNLNNNLLNEVSDKYAAGTISKWEMDSLSFYYHPHELANLKTEVYDIDDFNKLKENEIDREFPTKTGDIITLFKIHRIAGTVIDKDKNKSQVKLLTTTGVVNVKIWKNQFAKWDKQISEKGIDGKKHIKEKSWFQKGTKLIITGMRRGDDFVPKKYKSTSYPLFEKIDELDDKGFIIKSSTERVEEEEFNV